MENYDWENDFDDGDDNNDGAGHFSGKNVVLFAIYGGEGMHQDDSGEEGKSLFQKAVMAAVDTYKNKIFTAENDMLGVVFFGTTKKVPETVDFDNISVICSPSPPTASAIIQLEGLTGDAGKETFRLEYGWDGQVKLHEVLWQCQSLMAGVKGKVASRRILLLTCNADPHNGDQSLNIQARRKASDLHSNNIYLDVVPVIQNIEDFDISVIYSDIMKLADDDWNGINNSLDMLTETVLKKSFMKRSTGKLNFSINGVNIAVSVYNMLGKPKRPQRQKMVRNTSDLVRTERSYVHPIDQTPLLPSDINKFMNYGGKDIEVTEAEVQHIRSCAMQDNFIRLLGFRNKDSLKLGNHVKMPQFLYPCEDLIKGSNNLFAALLGRCAALNKIPICSYKPRSTSGPSYVALLPQPEELDPDSNVQVKPPGFHVIWLPFLDDRRVLPEVRMKLNNPSDAVEAARDVVRKLKLKKYIPVEDGSLQAVYRTIEAHALNKQSMDPVDDETLPDNERIKRKLGDRSEAFLNQVYDEDYDPAKFKPTKKSKPSTAKPKPAASAASNTAKSENLDMAAMVADGTVKKLTVDVLRTWLKEQGVTGSSKMKKADLIQEVESIFS